jgi:hypothetical protein
MSELSLTSHHLKVRYGYLKSVFNAFFRSKYREKILRLCCINY